MADDNNTESIRRPVALGGFVGLVVGLVGMLVGSLIPPDDTWAVVGAFLGAVAGGATAAYVSDSGLLEDSIVALFADLASSIAFFLLVVAGIAVTVGWNNDSVLAAIFATLLAGSWGLLIAGPIATVSLVIAVLAGATTSLTRRIVRSHRG